MPLLHSSSVLLLFFYAQVSFVRGEVFQTDLHMLNPSCLNRLRRFCPWLLLCSALVVWQDVAIVQAQVVNLHFSAIYSHTADLFGKFVKGQVFGAGFKLQSTDIGQHLYMPWHELLHVVTDCICSGGFFFFSNKLQRIKISVFFPVWAWQITFLSSEDLKTSQLPDVFLDAGTIAGFEIKFGVLSCCSPVLHDKLTCDDGQSSEAPGVTKDENTTLCGFWFLFIYFSLFFGGGGVFYGSWQHKKNLELHGIDLQCLELKTAPHEYPLNF